MTQTPTMLHANAMAEMARKRSSTNDINVNLTLARLMKLIENAAKEGNHYLIFETPSFVLDGSLTDRIFLAGQLKKKLRPYGYTVKKKGHVLNISWV